MVDVTQIPYTLVRGVYDSAIDGASDLVDGTLESAKNSLTSLISTTLLNNTAPSAYVEVVPKPSVISDVLFGPINIVPSSYPSRILDGLSELPGMAKRSILDPALDAASRAARGIWNALPDIPGIDVEQTAKSILSGIYTYIFGEDEVAAVPTTEVASNLVSGAEELARKVVAKVDAETQTARMARSSTGDVSSTSLSAPVTATSSSARTTESGSGLAVVISSIPPSTDAVAAASAVVTVGTGEAVVVGAPTTTENNGDGVEVSGQESSPGVFQTVLNFLTGTSSNASNTSNASIQNSSATAQISGLGLVFGGTGNTNQGTRSSLVLPAYHVLPPAVSRVFGDSGGPLTLGEAIYRVLTGAADPSEITSQTLTGLSATRTLFYSVIPVRSGSQEFSSLISSVVTSNNSATIDPAELAVIADIADLSDVPFPGLPSSTLPTGRIISDAAAALDTNQVASGLSANVSDIHSKFDANAQSGSQRDNHNGYENVRDAEFANNLSDPQSSRPTFVIHPSTIASQSGQVSVAV